MAVPPPDPAVLVRFRADLEALTGAAAGGERLGVAVSGGPDSLALLLLAAAAWPGRIEAATVDHGLRTGSAAEAAAAAAICARLGARHETLAPGWDRPPTGNVQAHAREARYGALARWAAGRGLAWIATAHHLDDQAETMLMRLARGAGLSGLSGIRPAAKWDDGGLRLVRPLLGWRKAELAQLVAAAGLVPADDPSNADARFDRTQARALLGQAGWLTPERIAAATANLAQAEEALDWAERRLLAERVRRDADGAVLIDANDVPIELQRRLLVRGMEALSPGFVPNGPKLTRLLMALREGQSGTLSGVRAVSGTIWHLAPAPPRRDRIARGKDAG